MLPWQFFAQNFHFSANLLASLALFAGFWLYFDAWVARKEFKEALKAAGFFLLSLSFIIGSTYIEKSVLGQTLPGNFSLVLPIVCRVLGYSLLIYGQLVDPLQGIPKNKGLTLGGAGLVIASSQVFSLLTLKLTLPALAFFCSFLYLRRATTGLERHLLKVAIAFSFLGLFELLSLGESLRNTTNPVIFSLVKSFGPLWIAAQVLLLIGMGILAKWLWQYLTTRLQTQLFMIFTIMVLAIYILTTVSFTALLTSEVQRNTLTNLETAGRTLDYALKSKKVETSSVAESVAANTAIVSAVQAKDRSKLTTLVAKIFESRNISSLVFADQAGMVLLRAQDPDKWGDSISDDPLTKHALLGETSTNIVSKEGVLAPLIFIESSTPMRDSNGSIVGVAIAGLTLDNAFADGIKNSTGLDSAIYALDTRSATTFVASDGKSRWVGLKETNPEVKKTVLTEGKPFQGIVSLLNSSFLASYYPLKNVNNDSVGMLFLGQPQSSVLQTAGKSIQITFFVAVILLVLSIIPSYFVARYLSKQLS